MRLLYLLIKYVGLCRPRCCSRSRRLLFYAQCGDEGAATDAATKKSLKNRTLRWFGFLLVILCCTQCKK